MIKLWNTLSRKYEDFKPLNGKRVGVYSCGPTVYNYAHIGNLRAYIFSDILKRALVSENYKVKHIINITDVGHLVADADIGEDKVEQAAREHKLSAKELTKKYTAAFLADLKTLNIIPADKFPRATDFIKGQIDLIKILEKKGYTYKTSDGVYFDTSKFKKYGTLSGQKLEEKEAGARVGVSEEKRHPQDFALWRFSPKGSKREMEWKSPWGVGFPGWHIECSVMSRKFLGSNFDIHTGGVDHIAVHHENEIAQSEVAYDEPLARVWMHNEFLEVDSGKMAKSLGNIYTVADLKANGFDPLAFRYLALGTHYRTPLNFTWEALAGASIALKKIYAMLRDADKPKVGCAEFEADFVAAIADDLNTSKALGVMWKLIDSDYPSSAKAKSLLKFDEVLGLNFKKYLGQKLKVPSAVAKLVYDREVARKSKDWAGSDKLRGQIEELGFTVLDTPKGPKIAEK